MDWVTEFQSVENIILAFAFLSPGFLLLFGRSQFLTGRIRSISSGVFEYLMVSSIYYSAAVPILLSVQSPMYWHYFALLFAIPLVLGFAIGFATQKEWFRKAVVKLGLNPVHSTPTAWDYAFGGKSGNYWVVVKLVSGGVYYGVWGANSLASSDLSRRDIYIEDVRTRDFKPVETDDRKRGVWISDVDIRSIELIKD